MTAWGMQALLLADVASDAGGRVVYEFGRLRSFDDERLPLVLAALATFALAAGVWYWYRRDTVELPRALGIGLALLRMVALASLFVFFLGIERRTTREVVHNSQVAVLVDVSQSMGLAESNETADAQTPSRLASIVTTLTDSPLLADLQQLHDVNIARFDQEVDPVVSLPKTQESQKSTDKSQEPEVKQAASESGSTSSEVSPDPDSWAASLQPRGTETRLGQALEEQLRLYRDAPLAAIVVISDGAQNAGAEPSAAIELAKSAKVPLFSIGVGSTEAQHNVAVRDLVVPTRAFPGDTLDVAGYLQASGYSGRAVAVELLRRRADEAATGGRPIATEQVTLTGDDEMVPVSFQVEPDEAGTFVYQLRVAAPADDANSRDNQREAEVEVVDRQTKVLLLAGGPSRDYQFLRNQLQRDRTMSVDVLLQTAQPGISQDANEVLDHFPEVKDDLYKYDCIVAFDPDWTQLTPEQIALLETWVSEEAGGLVAVAGPIYTAQWIHSADHAKLRDLYPVQFQQRLTLLDDGQFGSQTAWPLAFDRAGREAKFLWLEKTAEENETAWESFPGVYGYFAVKGEKPGATVYARYSDPEAGISNQRPVYLASQFYGAGRVFYIGSGEIWRLRTIDPRYFEVLYTKLIRHVSQGRILRGSSRASLLVERDRYELGETVVLRARLADAQHKPLERESVSVQALRPDGSSEAVKLAAETTRPGMYTGQVKVLQEGTYQVALPIPDSNEESLVRYLQVRIPDLERAHAQRNEPLLASLALETGGIYYKELNGAVNGGENEIPLAQAIESRAEVKLLKGAPDQKFAEAQMHWLLALIAGSLFVEWIVRRLNRLA